MKVIKKHGHGLEGKRQLWYFYERDHSIIARDEKLLQPEETSLISW